MIPIIWRHLLWQYLKVTFLSVVAMIAVLLTTRLDDIAHFASLDASMGLVLLFALFQVPYILPIAIPIGCLISSILLMQQLSRHQELTALRTSGMSIGEVMTPLILASGFLAICNFYLVSEVATQTHLTTNLWKLELRSVNPLLLLHNKHLMQLRGGYFDTMGDSRLGEYAQQVVMALPDKKNQRMTLLLADKLTARGNEFIGEGMTVISTRGENLMIENIEKTQASAENFSSLLQNKEWQVNLDHLQMAELLTKKHNFYPEIARRLSIAIATITFTLMGMAFGMSINRKNNRWRVMGVIFLTSLYLVAYFTAKGLGSSIIYFAPHFLILILSIWMLRRTSKGIS